MRYIAFVLALVLLLSLAGCGKVSVSGNHTTSPEGISLELLSVERTDETGTVLEVRWNNESDRDILFGSAFGVDRLQGNNWVKVNARPNVGFTMEAYLLRAHTSLERTYCLDWAYDVSKPGSYRLTVDYSFYDDENNTKHDLWTEFTVGKEPETAEPSQPAVNGNFEKGTFVRVSDWNSLEAQGREILVAAQGYDRAFFKDNDLLLLYLGEGSGSVKHSVTSCEIVDGILSVWIHKTNPATMTMDIARWFVLVPMKKGVEVTDIQIHSGTQSVSEKEFQEPPKLEIVHDSGTFEALKGTYSWFYTADGQEAAVCADSMHPLQMQKYLDLVHCGSNQIRLEFEDSPDAVTVRCWPQTAFGKTDTESQAAVIWNRVLELNTGGWIYEVTATWEEDGGNFHGTATYVFYMAPALLHTQMY